MFAGHLGAALALRRADRTIGHGPLVFAALWLDVLLWILVLVGVEIDEPRAPEPFRRGEA